MASKYCNNCKQQITPKADLTGKQYVIMILLCCCMFIPGMIYMFYALTSKKFKRCPICNDQNWGNINSNHS